MTSRRSDPAEFIPTNSINQTRKCETKDIRGSLANLQYSLRPIEQIRHRNVKRKTIVAVFRPNRCYTSLMH